MINLKLSPKLILAAVAIFVALLIIVQLLYANFFKSPPTPTSPNLDAIKEKSLRSDNNSNYLIAHDDDYRITYQGESNTYLITILDSPFDIHRLAAEEELLEFLQVGTTTACQLKIQITTPRFANPELSGQIFPPSFCTQ